jgi:hypothetical protein
LNTLYKLGEKGKTHAFDRKEKPLYRVAWILFNMLIVGMHDNKVNNKGSSKQLFY